MADGPAPLGPEARRVLALLCARVTAGLPGAPSPEACGALEAVEAQLAAAPSVVRHGIAGLLRVLDWLPPVVVGRLGRFTRLDAAGQDAFVERLVEHRLYPLRAVVRAVVAICYLGYYSRPAVQAVTGFDPAARVAWSRSVPYPAAPDGTKP